MRMLPAFAACFALLAGAGGTPSSMVIRYACDETSGVVLRDSGALKQHGRLARATAAALQDVSFTPARMGVWQPILRDGVQIKGTHPGSDRILTTDEQPIVLDRGDDYEIDCAGGRLKAAQGGRMSRGRAYLVEVTHTNPGPTRVPGRKGKALSFDGVDDFVDCGDLEDVERLTKLDVSLWLRLSAKAVDRPVLLSLGSGISLSLEGGRIVFRHAGLATPLTRSAGPVLLPQGKWLHLQASFSGNRTSIRLNGREVGSAKGRVGTLVVDGPLRLGGVADPGFFKGVMDEVAIALLPVKTPPEH